MFILLKFSALQSDLEPADAVAKGIDENWRKDYGISTSSQLDSTYLDDFCKTDVQPMLADHCLVGAVLNLSCPPIVPVVRHL